MQVANSFGREILEDVESGSGSGDWGTSDGLPDDDEDRLNGYDTGMCYELLNCYLMIFVKVLYLNSEREMLLSLFRFVL